MRVDVKICGVMRPEDGRVAVEAGARFVGVILTPGFGRSVSRPLARRILDAAAGARRVGVMVDPSAELALSAARELDLDVVQLHGSEPPELVEAVSGGGSWHVWKAIRLGGGQGVDALTRYRPWVAGALVDAWDPDHPGGAGVRYPWEGVGEEVRAAFPDGCFVAAGGLTPENVGEAVRMMRPDVVDVSSGVEASPGRKDPGKVRAFVEAASAAAPSPAGGDRGSG